MSLVKPSFSHIFLNRRSICSAVSLPRNFTLIIRFPKKSCLKPIPPESISLADLKKSSSRVGLAPPPPTGDISPHGRPRPHHHHPRPLPRGGPDGLPASQPLFPVFRDWPGRTAPLDRPQLRRTGEGGNLLRR